MLPTSGQAVGATLDFVDFDQARVVVEMGAGTGPYTREIVKRLHPDAHFWAYEIDHALAAGLKDEIDDPRVTVVAGTAATMAGDLGGRKADIVVSAIPFTSLPAGVRHALLDAAKANLAPDGTFCVLQYSPFIQKHLNKAFGSVRRRIVPLNVPPAFLFACRNPT